MEGRRRVFIWIRRPICCFSLFRRAAGIHLSPSFCSLVLFLSSPLPPPIYSSPSCSLSPFLSISLFRSLSSPPSQYISAPPPLALFFHLFHPSPFRSLSSHLFRARTQAPVHAKLLLRDNTATATGYIFFPLGWLIGAAFSWYSGAHVHVMYT